MMCVLMCGWLEDVWDLPHPQQLVVADPIGTAGTAVRYPGVSSLVRARISTLAMFEGTVRTSRESPTA